MSKMEQNYESQISREEILSAVQMWIEYLQATLFEGITATDVEQLMESVARDKAWIYYGGTGSRSRLYMIDDYVQVQFNFDLQDILVAYVVCLRRGGWLKGPDGVLLRGFETQDTELLFP